MKNQLLLITRNSIPYIKEIRPVTGSISGAILMQQLEWWFHHSKGSKFYKFLEPPEKENRYYKEGDSWTEELGFSDDEFRTAFKYIGIRYSSKKEYDNAPNKFSNGKREFFYCSYFDKIERLTYYERNNKMVDGFLTAVVNGESLAEYINSALYSTTMPHSRGRHDGALGAGNVVPYKPEMSSPINTENTHENTTENTTEITPNTWSSQSSDNKCGDLEITSPEKNTKNVSGKALTKAQIKKDLVNSKLQSPEFIKFFEEIRGKYSLYAGNRFLNYFAKHKSQFYKTLAYRVANEDFTQEEVEKVFGLMTQNTDFSLIEFFGNLKNQKYDEKKILVDFIWVMNDGKISAPTAERKGAKELCGWITENKTTLKEIEDCLLWFPDSGRGYKNSLLSVKSALSEFGRVKRDIGNGRYVGSALNGGYKTKDEKTVETLSQRDYDSTAKDVLAAGKAQKEYLQSLIEGTK